MKSHSLQRLWPWLLAGLSTLPSSAASPDALNAGVGSYAPSAARRESVAARLDKAAARLDAGERKSKLEFEDLRRESALTQARLIARGRTYVRWKRAGLLPLVSGFDQFMQRATRLERLHELLTRDIKREQELEKAIVATGKHLEVLNRDRANLETKRTQAREADLEVDSAEERALAFERAFATPPKDGHTAVYGASMPLTGDASPSDIRKMKGHLPFPVTGRTEIVRAKRRGGGGPGLEMRVSRGSAVQAVFAGRVVFADEYADFGKTVILDHGNGFFTVSAGLANMRARVGEDLSAGATLGTVGDTGLYFEIRRAGDTVDPAPWFGL